LTGYARCSTDKQDLAARRQALAGLGAGATPAFLRAGQTTDPGTIPDSRLRNSGQS